MTTVISPSQLSSKQLSLSREIELAFTIRAVEQKLLDLYRDGAMHGTVHTCTGQEWTGVAVGRAIKPDDLVFSNHRGHGHFLGCGGSVNALIAEVLGRATGVCKGMGGTQHLCNGQFFSNGILGGMVPVAAGAAMARKFAGNSGIAVVFVGDGAMSEGVIYEAFNLAATFGLPLYVVCEANGIAQSTPVPPGMGDIFLARAKAFGLTTLRSDTQDWKSLLGDVDGAIETVRTSGRPLFHLVDTFRLNAHSKGDDTRLKDVVAARWKVDSLSLLMEDQAWQDELARANLAVELAVEMGIAAEPATALPAFDLRTPSSAIVWNPWKPCPGTLVARLRNGLKAALETDERVVLLGEDILSPYGGAFKATQGLSDLKPDRVFGTPICEPGMIGLGNGLALAGYRPVVEIMFGDFMSLGLDQLLNHAAKFSYMYGDQIKVPVIVRTPMGGRRGYGPTHSQSIEKHFLGIPGLAVAAVHHRLDATALYRDWILENDGPLLLIENKVAYGKDGVENCIVGYDYLDSGGRWPTLLLRPPGDAQCTILCYGGMLIEAERAADLLLDEHDIFVEIVCPTRLYPLDMAPIIDSVRRTRRFIIAEEGFSFAAFGAEVLAELAETSNLGGVAVRRLGSAPHPIPAAIDAELSHLPDAKMLVTTVRELIT